VTPARWNTRRLGELCRADPDYGVNAPAAPYSPELPRFIRISDIDDAGKLRPEGQVSIEVTGNEQSLLEQGDFLFARTGATVGKTLLYTADVGPAVFAGYLIRFRPDPKVLLPRYLGLFTQTHRYWYWVSVTLRQGAQPNINAQEYASLPIPLPPLPEQRRIAEILSTWDEALALLDRRIELAQQRKKGLAQRVLTGRVRFPEFVRSTATQSTRYGELPADWRYVPIGSVAREVSVKNRQDHNLPVLSCTKHDGLVDSLEYFGRQIFSDDLTTYKVVERGQFAYATNHIEEGSIGYQAYHDAALISPMYTVFQPVDQVDDDFLFRVLKTEKYRHIFEINTSGTVDRRGSLRWDDFSSIRIPLPTLPEQRRIAEVLRTCDEEIALLRRKRELTAEQKKGLMQRLLTGRVRVKV